MHSDDLMSCKVLHEEYVEALQPCYIFSSCEVSWIVMWNLNICLQLCVSCCPCGGSSCVLCVLYCLADCGMPVCCVVCVLVPVVCMWQSKRRHGVCCCPGVAAVVYVAAREAPRCICGSPRDATRGNQVVRVVATDGC